ncbi:MAG: hypothetical protein J7L79_00200 [Thaumarchaeota archaeon]|nr:hypothetical protein [Nitrososphaerota archaeon]
MRGRKAISVMFMTFIAISILTAVFLTMYLYLLRAQTLATDAERLYAEAAQEKLEVYLDRLADDGNGEILVENVGGIGVAVKYVVELDWSGKTAKMCEIGETVPVNSSLVIKLSQCPDAISPNGDLYILTERGNMFKAIRGGFKFELEVEPASTAITSGGYGPVTLRLKAMLLETPQEGLILIVADPSSCIMTASTTITETSESYELTTTVVKVKPTKGGGFITVTIPIVISASTTTYTSTQTLEENFVSVDPSEVQANFSTRITATKTFTVTVSALDIGYWVTDASCFIWFKALNATSGDILAESGMKLEAQ